MDIIKQILDNQGNRVYPNTKEQAVFDSNGVSLDVNMANKADKTATVSNVSYNTTSKKITKTINGTTTDVVSAAAIVQDGGVYASIDEIWQEIASMKQSGFIYSGIYYETFKDTNWDSPITQTNGAAKCLYGRSITNYDYTKMEGKTIVAIKVDIRTVQTGRFQVGVLRYMSSLGAEGTRKPYDPDDLEIQTIDNVTHTGLQIIILPRPITVGSGDWIGVGNINLDNQASGTYICNFNTFTNTSNTGVCYIDGPMESAQYMNTVYDSPNTNGCVGIDFLYAYEV